MIENIFSILVEINSVFSVALVREEKVSEWCFRASRGIKHFNAKGRLWVSNPVCGALVVTILPLGQLGPLDALCSQMRVLVHKRVGALMEASSVTVRFFWGFRESQVESNVANNLRKT